MAESGEEDSAASGDRDPPSQAHQSLVRQFAYFLRDNAVWWITPIIIVLAVMIIVSLLAGRAELPFIYR